MYPDGEPSTSIAILVARTSLYYVVCLNIIVIYIVYTKYGSVKLRKKL